MSLQAGQTFVTLALYHAKLGNMADARSALELPSVVASSKALIGASAAATVLAAAYTL